MPLSQKEQQQEETIQKLRAELADLRNKPSGIREVPVEPADYRSLKSENRKLQDICKRLSRVIESGKITTISIALDEFEGMVKARLRKLSAEILANDFSEEDVKSILEFSDFLSDISSQLYGQVSIYQQGRYIDNGVLRQCDRLRIEVADFLGSNSFIDGIDPSKAEMLYSEMKKFMECASQCMKEDSA